MRTILTPLLLSFLSLPGQADWPQFRGPDGQGVVRNSRIPLTWNAQENAVWSVNLPGTGFSSPVVRGDRIWVTTAVKTQPTGEQIAEQEKTSRLTPELFKRRQVAGNISLQVLCLNRKTGALIRKSEFASIESPQAIHVGNSYASPTPVIDGKHLYVHFGIYGTACLEADTLKTLWKREIPVFYSVGVGSSPVVYQNLLIVTCDGIDTQFVIGLNRFTGRTEWKTVRPPIRATDGQLRKAYSTPLIIHHNGRDQAIIPGAQWFVSYDPLTGKELWRVDHGDGFSNVPRPVFASGVVYLCTGYTQPELWAVRVDGQGDVTETHVNWKVSRQIPANPSPLLVDDLLFTVSDNGIVSCFDARSGKTHWQKRIGGNFSASPVFANGHVFFCSHTGDISGFQATATASEPVTSHIDGEWKASPVVLDSSVLLRSSTTLFQIQ